LELTLLLQRVENNSKKNGILFVSSHLRFSKKMILFSLTNAHLKSQQNHTSDVFGSTIVNISLDSDLLSLLRKKKYQRLMLTPSADGLE